MSIEVDLKGTNIAGEVFEQRRDQAAQALADLWSGKMDFTGWVKLPLDISEEAVREVEMAAAAICGMCDCFVVLGVGGSYIGAKAVTDLLGNNSGTEVIFAGYDFSARYVNELMEKLADRDVCLCVISKSGSTAETLSACGIFREFMLKKYGPEEMAGRMFAVTEDRPNFLHDLAERDGSRIFSLAEDIGGRYSVLTPVGMLPAAVSGIDIRRILRGAAEMASPDRFSGDALDYAIARQYLYGTGKNVEVFEFFDPYAVFFGEWLKQLFGESEGKDGKGIFPASLIFSRDLHSVGQFLQQGTACVFETLVTVQNEPGTDVKIPDDSVPPYAGKTLKQINTCAVSGVYDAHVKAGIPVVRIQADRLSPENVGRMLYFFETQCAVSAMLSGVNPFDQPGVEAYKSAMRGYVKKLG